MTSKSVTDRIKGLCFQWQSAEQCVNKWVTISPKRKRRMQCDHQRMCIAAAINFTRQSSGAAPPRPAPEKFANGRSSRGSMRTKFVNRDPSVQHEPDEDYSRFCCLCQLLDPISSCCRAEVCQCFNLLNSQLWCVLSC